MKIGLVIFLFLMIMTFAAAEDGITKAVPVNIKTHCEVGFTGEKFCESNAIHQYYQNDVCFKYNKIIESCADNEICENAECITKKESIDRQNDLITGNAVKETSSEGFFSRIINWFKGLFS